MMSHDGLRDGFPQNVQSSEGDDKQTSCSDQDALVWLRATIADAGKDMDGCLLCLLIGPARVSVLVAQEHDHFACWAAGMLIEIHIDRYEAWVKPAGRDGPPVLCGLLYLDHQSVASAR
ncbi:MAG: hypothetical protein LZF62_240254 [Nitrospira sp.]|nr:MAG: hypothetical protein LZF62_240254 [Nitrospira sp.]